MRDWGTPHSWGHLEAKASGLSWRPKLRVCPGLPRGVSVLPPRSLIPSTFVLLRLLFPAFVVEGAP